MATPKQIEANRNNARKSTGPRTEEGKARACLNARRHNLTGQVTLMPAEDLAAHDAFCRDLAESLNPSTPMERQLAQSIASDQWRLNRMRAIEDNLLSLGLFDGVDDIDTDHPQIDAAVAAARVFAEDPHRFQLLSLYIQRTSREIHRNMELLHRLQSDRRAARLEALAEASNLRQVCEERKVPYSALRADITGEKPAIGFDFSPAEIEAFRVHDRWSKRPVPLLPPLRQAA